ncbi:MAG: MBL fold metallo-hydrolase [Eubacterium sp.]|nr:MBL fold metallo-hydrolase [Eubacterium sp.]
MTITNLDVGQGDCAVVQFEDGTNIMIDGGSSDVNEVGEYRIVPFLKYMGIDRLDYVFVTHSDADHVSGIKEMLETDLLTIDMPVIVLPEIDNKDENYVELEELIIASGREIKYMKKGDSILLGDLEHNASDDNISYDNEKQTKIRCLHPYPEYNYTDVNDYSLVLEISYGNFRGIFTGDLGADAEAELTDLNDVDYLKVGHHGSKNSSSEAFLSTIKPEVSVASAGKDNRYHHPATEAVNRIKASGSDFFCTIVSGAVTTHTDGTKIAVSEYRSVS